MQTKYLVSSTAGEEAACDAKRVFNEALLKKPPPPNEIPANKALFTVVIVKGPVTPPPPGEIPHNRALYGLLSRALLKQQCRARTHLDVDGLIREVLEDSKIIDLLVEAGVAPGRVESELEKLVLSKKGEKATLQSLNTYKRDLVAARLHDALVGQDQAISVVAEALGRRIHPTGCSFLFVGPSGVGKGELAKALAYHLFCDENRLISIDMHMYPDQDSVARLIGSPHVYVGQLTEAVRKRPDSVVNFDHVDKAHASVLNTLHQVLDGGKLTDGHGRTLDFRNAVVIMTSNVGAGHFFSELSGKVARDQVMQEVRSHYGPELLNRVDEIVVFDPLSVDQLREVARLHVDDDVAVRLIEKRVAIVVTDAALDFAVAESYDPFYGARPMKRWLERKVVTEISMMMNRKEVEENSTVYVDVGPEGTSLAYRVKKKGGTVDEATGHKSNF